MSIAVASIVDANTGNGINQNFVDQFASNDADYERQAREVRSNTFIALLSKIKSSVGAYIDRSIAAARERDNIRAISSMSEHLQKDIGLTHIDIEDLRWGAISLDELSDRRKQNLDQRPGLTTGNDLANSSIQELAGIDQDSFKLGKCA